MARYLVTYIQRRIYKKPTPAQIILRVKGDVNLTKEQAAEDINFILGIQETEFDHVKEWDILDIRLQSDRRRDFVAGVCTGFILFAAFAAAKVML